MAMCGGLLGCLGKRREVCSAGAFARSGGGRSCRKPFWAEPETGSTESRPASGLDRRSSGTLFNRAPFHASTGVVGGCRWGIVLCGCLHRWALGGYRWVACASSAGGPAASSKLYIAHLSKNLFLAARRKHSGRTKWVARRCPSRPPPDGAREASIASPLFAAQRSSLLSSSTSLHVSSASRHSRRSACCIVDAMLAKLVFRTRSASVFCTGMCKRSVLPETNTSLEKAART